MLQALALVCGVALLAAVGMAVKQRVTRGGAEDADDAGEITQYVTGMVGVLYAIVLGLALVAVWDDQSNAQDHVQAEAGALHQTVLLAPDLPAAQAAEVRRVADAYAHRVVAVEWPEMAAGRVPDRGGWTLLAELRAAEQLRPGATRGQQAAAQDLLGQFDTLTDARRGRESDVGQALAPALWAGLIVGGVLSIVLLYFFTTRRGVVNLILVMSLAAMLAFTLLIIYELDSTFSGLLAVEPDALQRYFPNA